MMIACESCGKKFRADERLHGKTVKCPNCGGAIHIPAPAAPSIADLLDDELPMAPPEEEAPAAQAQGPKCRQCGDELPPDTRNYVVCGCNNFDADAAVGQVAMDFDKRQQRLENQARPRHWLLTALMWWSR